MKIKVEIRGKIQMIKIGICDDEKIFRDSIGKLIKQYFIKNGLEYEQKEYESGKIFIEQNEKTDILFLDIEMNGLSGIQLKEWLQKDENIKILFVTSHMEAMQEAFGKNVYGFLKKPLEKVQLEKYLDRMIEDIAEDESLVIKSVNKEMAIKKADIFYFVSEKKYSRINTRDGIYFCDKGLYHLEKELVDRCFFRCHKSYLVNLQNISRIADGIYMENGEKIPVSRKRVKELKDAYREYIIRKAR